jgi:hypothetical protein
MAARKRPKPKLKATAVRRPSIAPKGNAKPARKAKPVAAPKVTIDSVLAAIDAAETSELRGRLGVLDRLDDVVSELEGEAMAGAMSALRAAQQRCIEFARTDPDARAALLASVQAGSWRGDRIEQLGAVAHAQVYQLVREQAQKQLDSQYYQTRPEWLFALAGFARQGPFADQARALVLGGFDHYVNQARRSSADDRGLVNTVGFAALAYAAATIAHRDTGPALHRAFRIAAGLEEIDAHYALNQSTGALAVALAAVDYTPAVEDIEVQAGDGEEFNMQCQYALWMLREDGAGALAFLEDLANKKAIVYAATALADLDYKPATDAVAMRHRRISVTNPITRETLMEALHRLRTQEAPPPPAARMIWLFGRTSRTQIALGEASDNVFMQRAEIRR